MNAYSEFKCYISNHYELLPLKFIFHCFMDMKHTKKLLPNVNLFLDSISSFS